MGESNISKTNNSLDIFGVAKLIPTETVLNMFASFVSALSKPYRDRWDIKTDVIRIREYGSMIKEAKENGLEVTYSPDGLKINSSLTPQDAGAKDEIKEIVQSTFKALASQELEKNLNRASVINHALNVVKDIDEPKDPVSKDWQTRFFRIAEDISNEDVQFIWGQILAGEIIKPKSYSLRTLETLRFLSAEDAEIFQRVALFAIRDIDNRVAFIDKTRSERNLDFDSVLYLREIGLLRDNDNLAITLNLDIDQTKTFYCGAEIVTVEAKEKPVSAQISAFVYTKVGEELLRVTDTATSTPYSGNFARHLQSLGFSARSAIHIEGSEDGGYKIIRPPINY